MTTFADIVIPENFAEYNIARTKERSPILMSDAVYTDPEFASFLAGGGQTTNVPHWNPLDQDESNVSDDSADLAPLAKIDTHNDIAIRHNRNKHWTSRDMAYQLAGSDPLDAIDAQIADYWGLDIQKTLIASMAGVLADNVANNGGDMVYSVANDDPVPIPDTAKISGEALLDAMQTMGDASQDLALLVMHSAIHNELKKQQLIDFIPDWRGEVSVPTYMGKPIIITDQLAPVAGTNRPTYTTYLLSRGSIAWAESPARVPIETDRQPREGNGGGNETLHTRRQFIVHPAGIKFNSTTMAKASPTNAELALPANWTRVRTERKQVGIAFLQTNG